MLMSKRDFIAINVTNENTQVQILKPEITGDKDIVSAHASEKIIVWWDGA